jgi:hypothetical protein
MATLYCDFENGDDNYGGTSFALLTSGTDGRINSTTFSSATASFPNDGSLIGQYLSIFVGSIYAVYNITAYVSPTSLTIAAISGGTALVDQTVDRQFYIGGRWKSLTNGAIAVRTIPGDTVRIMGSPAPTSLGQNGVWTSQALRATKNITSITSATPASVTCTAHGYATGDTVVITGTTNDNYNGTFEITVTGTDTFTLNDTVADGASTSGTARLRNNTRVMLTTAVTQTIASTGPASLTGSGRRPWTATPGGNVTCSFNVSAGKEGRVSDSIAIAAGFTTGLAAYWALPSTLDLSGYQQVSFWIQQTVGTIGAAGAVDLRLCSDNAGATAVNTINIPNLATTSRWMPVTVDLATNLGNSIQSIALYVNTDNGAQTFLLNNIIACKASSAADSLTLTSLIGKNTTGETFWGIQSINGRRVMLDADTNAGPTTSTLRGYYGTSETVTTWKRETIKLGPAASSSTALQMIQDSGTEGSPITFSGGWNRTDMSTQSLETWLDGVNGLGIGVYNFSSSFITLEKLAFTRLYQGVDSTSYQATSAGNIYSIIAANNCITGLKTSNPGCIVTVDFANANRDMGCDAMDAASAHRVTVKQANSNGTNGVSLPSAPSVIVVNAGNNGNYGAYLGSHSGPVNDSEFRENSTSSVGYNTVSFREPAFNNCLFFDNVEVASFIAGDYIVSSHNHDQVAGNHKIFMGYALISAATDQRKTPSGISWKIQPTSTNRSSAWPVLFSLAKVACIPNKLVTVKAWMRRNNTGLTMRLVCKGGQLAGVANDVVSSMTAAADTWQELTITFTPTVQGVVEVIAEAWGGSTFSGWVDDMTISQAV